MLGFEVSELRAELTATSSKLELAEAEADLMRMDISAEVASA